MTEEEIKEIESEIIRLKYIAEHDRRTGYIELAEEREKYAGWFEQLLKDKKTKTTLK